jgi:phage shock protein E
VRSEGEFLQQALPRAINVPLPRLAGAAAALDPQQFYLLYCASGVRSSQAKLYLQALGFNQVANLGGYRNFLNCNGY